MKHASILIVEDEAIVAKSIEKRLISCGYAVAGSVATGTGALAVATRTRPDLILLDIRLKGSMDGIEVARTVRTWFGIPVIFVTAFADNATIERANETGPYGYLTKPFGENNLLSVIELALLRIGQEKSDAETFPQEDSRHPAILDTAPVAMAGIDPDKKIILLNAAFETLTGCSRTELAGRANLESFIDTGDMETVSGCLRIFQIDPSPARTDISVHMKSATAARLPVTLRLERIEGTFLVAISFLPRTGGSGE